jgi:hypothetical protein
MAGKAWEGEEMRTKETRGEKRRREERQPQRQEIETLSEGRGTKQRGPVLETQVGR